MKKILLFTLMVLFFTNCQKILHPEDISIGKIQNYNQLVSATNGLYGALANAISDNNFYTPNLKGDDLTAGNPDYDSYYIQNANCFQATNYSFYSASYNWASFYSAIVSANNILKQYNLAQLKDKLTKQALGEIYLIRAYCYFRLTRVYGQIPIIKNIDISYTSTKATYTEMYSFIENDLKLAMGLLPVNNSSARVPYITVHRGTAKAILAELYLNWGGYPIKDISKYGLAAKEAGESIDSASYFGFGLLNDFANVWDSSHIMNSESVFSVYFAKLANLSINVSVSHIPYSGLNCLGLLQTSANSPNMALFYFTSEVNFFNNYPPGYRKEITFFKTIYVPNNGGGTKTGYLHIDKVSTCNRIEYRKFYYQCNEDKNASTTNVCWLEGIPRVYIFRFAQTMLTYAEGIARSGQPDAKAYDCINQIRRRAHQLDLNSPSAFDLSPGLSPSAFADSVVQERACELSGEPEGRWFDLVRLEMVEDLPKIRNPKEGGPPSVFDKSVYFSPIPATDTILNPNMEK